MIRRKSPFYQTCNMPLFMALRDADSLVNGSRILTLIAGKILRKGHTKYSCVQAVLIRCLRDKNMHILDYEKLAWKLANRYNTTCSAMFENCLVTTEYQGASRSIGFVKLSGGEISFLGSSDPYNIPPLIRDAAKYRDEEIKKKKYQKLSDAEKLVHTVLLETKGVIDGKARIFRQKNHAYPTKRTRFNVSAVGVDGCFD